MSAAPVIRKLDETTVNRIAAGEVVQKPSAAIKEMLENSLDAGATSITITSKNGGLALLQISDNGHGINKDDLAIVCERFTTSKLTTYDDLKTVSTFGFRGEALASITHVAHVTIQTKTASSPCAYKAKYSDGKLVPMKPGSTSVDPVACAGVNGTTITVEDLFYNMQTRKQAFKNPNEQYQKILDIVTKYAIHYGDKRVAFTCKKVGQTTPDIHTPASSSTMENLKIAFGPALARELLPFSLSVDETVNSDDASSPSSSKDRLVFSMDGYLSSANYSSKKSTCIIFINNRLVECQNVKRVIENVYNDVLPKNSHPFVYLSIIMPFEHVDVNVHPTKKEVHFLYEEQLLQRLFMSVFERLRHANESRTFFTQSLLTLVGSSAQEAASFHEVRGDSTGEVCKNDDEDDEVFDDSDATSKPALKTAEASSNVSSISNTGSSAGSDADRDFYLEMLGSKRKKQTFISSHVSSSSREPARTGKGASGSGGPSSSVGQSVAANKLIRVDASVAMIDTFFRPQDATMVAARARGVEEEEEGEQVGLVFCENCVTTNATAGSSPLDGKAPRGLGTCSCCEAAVAPAAAPISIINKLPPLLETSCEYTSVQSLLLELRSLSHAGMTRMLRSHSFVGVLNSCHCIVQFETRLLMLDHARLLKHLFYQLTIRQFGGMGMIHLGSRASDCGVVVRDYILAALDLPEAQWDAGRGSKESVADAAAQMLAARAELLSEYFKIVIDADGILRGLPELLVGYTPCPQRLPLFLLRLATQPDYNEEKACFHGVAVELAALYAGLGGTAAATTLCEADKAVLKGVLLPAIRQFLLPPQQCVDDGTVVQLASLEQLYRIFERC